MYPCNAPTHVIFYRVAPTVERGGMKAEVLPTEHTDYTEESG